jgi:hypothetical protein
VIHVARYKLIYLLHLEASIYLSYLLHVSLDLFRELENLESLQNVQSNDESELPLENFGVSINSLEEVLLKIGMWIN